MSCDKETYLTPTEAMQARRGALKRKCNRPEFLTTYWCAECHGYHLTHQRPAVRKRQRRW